MRARLAQTAQLQADTWHQVAQAGNLQELQAAVPADYQHIPIGKRTRIVINTSPWPVAPLFDLAGAEFAAQLLVHGGKLIDVSGNGAFEIVFEIEAAGSSATVSQESSDSASMGIGFMAIAAIILVIALILILVPKQAAMFVNYVAQGLGTGIAAFFETLLGKNWPLYVAGAAVLVYFLLLRPGKSGSAPITYIIGKKALRGGI